MLYAHPKNISVRTPRRISEAAMLSLVSGPVVRHALQFFLKSTFGGDELKSTKN